MEQATPPRPPKISWVLSNDADAHAHEQYRDEISTVFEITHDRDLPPGTFYNHFECYHAGAALIGRGQSTAQTYHRSPTTIRRSGIDQLQVILERESGIRADYDGRDVDASAGAVRIVDMSRPFRSTIGEFDLISLAIPRSALPPAYADHDLHGLVLPEAAPATRLLTAHLGTLWTMMDEVSTAEATAAVEATIVLLGCALSDERVLPEESRAPVERTLLAVAKRMIAAHLGDFTLTPEAVRAHLGVSMRTLYRLFQDIGGVSGYIQNRRLDRALRMMTDADAAHVAIADIAYANGFLSPAHFSRAFKDRFGMRPGDARMGADPVIAHPDDGVDSVVTWLRAL